MLIDRGADLSYQNKGGKSAFYTVIKYAPEALNAIEKRFDQGLKMDSPENDRGPEIQVEP